MLDRSSDSDDSTISGMGEVRVVDGVVVVGGAKTSHQAQSQPVHQVPGRCPPVATLGHDVGHRTESGAVAGHQWSASATARSRYRPGHQPRPSPPNDEILHDQRHLVVEFVRGRVDRRGWCGHGDFRHRVVSLIDPPTSYERLRPRVTSSANSRSPPMGSPSPTVSIRTPPDGGQLAAQAAVASPSVFGSVARMISWTDPSASLLYKSRCAIARARSRVLGSSTPPVRGSGRCTRGFVRSR